MGAVSTLSFSLALAVVGGLAFLGCPAAAQQFSADLVSTDAAGRTDGTAGKLYVSDGAVRFELPDFRDGLFVVDANTNTAYFVRPAEQIFMDAKQSSRLTQILVPVDPNNPCKEWQAMAVVAGAADQGGKWHCRPLGPDNVAGRAALKYQATSPQGRTDYAWIDPQLKFPVRFQYQDGTRIELDAIREGPQPTQLFAIPAGFQKFDPRELIEHIKQSDVWVEPPK
jgi:hypothetical protein